MKHRERLARFRVEHPAAALEAQARRLGIADSDELSTSGSRSMIDVCTSMWARWYRRGAAQKSAMRAVTAVLTGPGAPP